VNSTIIKLAAQALLGRRRFWLLLAFPVMLVALTVLIAALTDGDAAWPLLPGLGYPVVLPLVAVLAASSVLGPEVDDGSILYLLSKPISRHAIAISKWVVAGSRLWWPGHSPSTSQRSWPEAVTALLRRDSRPSWPARRTPRSSSPSRRSPGMR